MARIEARDLEPGMLARSYRPWTEPDPFQLVDKTQWFSCYGTPMTHIWFADGPHVKVPADDLFDVLDDTLEERAS